MPAADVLDPQDQRQMMDLRDIAQYFRVSHETARRIVRSPGFPLYARERTLRIPRQAFLKWLEQQTGHQEGV